MLRLLAPAPTNIVAKLQITMMHKTYMTIAIGYIVVIHAIP